ncbi:D-alanyl-D-alanine carboxypeptidase family protein [Salipaludibacillus aurantiacus]|uniref:D-alanyl-D-alanine carboxypeptidase n=1 Tax=Salipaludibacillus aurantiacus TaxID=1601833 RepID=A0A1H9PCZ1_9BACI|nr:D-alanyl-D-alanine carboxypeptidase family protein [Salipaludibacillus aurantiacus]SER46027.1 D-alanyl-D-alanine carboxypeptidase [Salipaludibacillus aurantiacus]
MKLPALLSICIILAIFPFGSEVSAEQFFDKGVSAHGAILMEQESGRILFEKESNTRMRIASITKIMTAVLAIESGKMEETVTVSSRAFGTEGSSIYLTEGEKISLEDLVYGLMLRSGNDAAIAIAEHVGGSVEGFVYMMNEKAREIGMEETLFANPHGLDDHEDHYSTAYDMALLTQYAMKSPQYREISASKSYRSVTAEDRIRVFNNKNRLLTQLYKHSTGGKTGYTKRAKRTLVSTAEKEGMELIAVTINAPSDWHDHMNLFEWGFDSYEMSTLVKEGTVKKVDDPFYKNKLRTEFSFQYPLTEEDLKHLKKRVVLLKPNEERWEQEGYPYPIGTVQVELKGKVIGIVPLKYVYEKTEEPSLFKKWLGHWFRVNGMVPNG